MKRVIIGVSGATGSIYGIGLLQMLEAIGGVETHRFLQSRYARMNIEIWAPHSARYVEMLADEVHDFLDQAS